MHRGLENFFATNLALKQQMLAAAGLYLICLKRIWVFILIIKRTRSQARPISLFTAMILKRLKKLKAKGVKFKGKIEDHGYGLVTNFKAPCNFYIQLYQPRYKK